MPSASPASVGPTVLLRIDPLALVSRRQCYPEPPLPQFVERNSRHCKFAIILNLWNKTQDIANLQSFGPATSVEGLYIHQSGEPIPTKASNRTSTNQTVASSQANLADRRTCKIRADVAVARIQVRSGSIGGGWAFAPKAIFGISISELKRER